jgi:hypothetical protein
MKKFNCQQCDTNENTAISKAFRLLCLIHFSLTFVLKKPTSLGVVYYSVQNTLLENISSYTVQYNYRRYPLEL